MKQDYNYAYHFKRSLSMDSYCIAYLTDDNVFGHYDNKTFYSFEEMEMWLNLHGLKTTNRLDNFYETTWNVVPL